MKQPKIDIASALCRRVICKKNLEGRPTLKHDAAGDSETSSCRGRRNEFTAGIKAHTQERSTFFRDSRAPPERFLQVAPPAKNLPRQRLFVTPPPRPASERCPIVGRLDFFRDIADLHRRDVFCRSRHLQEICKSATSTLFHIDPPPGVSGGPSADSHEKALALRRACQKSRDSAQGPGKVIAL